MKTRPGVALLPLVCLMLSACATGPKDHSSNTQAGTFKSLPDKLVSEDADERGAALKKLEEMKPEARKNLVPELLEMLESTDQDWVLSKRRLAAIQALGAIGQEASEAALKLRVMFETTPSPDLYSALQKIGTPEAQEAIRRWDAKVQEERAQAEAERQRCKADDKGMSDKEASLRAIECHPKFGLLQENPSAASLLPLHLTFLQCLYSYSDKDRNCSVGVNDDTREVMTLAHQMVDHWRQFEAPKAYFDLLARFAQSELYTDGESVTAKPTGDISAEPRTWPRAELRGASALSLALMHMGQKQWAQAAKAMKVARQSLFYTGAWSGYKERIVSDYISHELWLWLDIALRTKNLERVRQALTEADYTSIIMNPKKHTGRAMVFPVATVLRAHPPGQLDRSPNAYLLCAIGEPKSERIREAYNTSWTWDSYLARISQALTKDDRLFLVLVSPKQLEQVERLTDGQKITVLGTVTGQFKENLVNHAIPTLRLVYLDR